jgi:hypothetical protein
MSQPSSSTTLRALFDAALQDYKGKTGNALLIIQSPGNLKPANLPILLPPFFKNKHGAFVNLGKMIEGS